MKEQFVPYEIALKLKELGFDELCFAHYVNGDLITKTAILKSSTMQYYQQNNINPSNQYKDKKCTAPLWQQVIDWFREKHNIHIEIELTDNTMQFYYQYCIVDSKNRECHDEDMIDQATRIYNYNEKFNTFYEAREQAILKAIELIKNKN